MTDANSHLSPRALRAATWFGSGPCRDLRLKLCPALTEHRIHLVPGRSLDRLFFRRQVENAGCGRRAGGDHLRCSRFSGGTWGLNGTILFASTWGVLYRVSSSGGAATAVTKLDSSRGELSHRWPVFLPDSRHFLFSAANFAGGSAESASISVADLDSGEKKLLFHARSNAAYTPGPFCFCATEH